jgi:prepilin-type N-terminal cleavage/methylation domain-containing protein
MNQAPRAKVDGFTLLEVLVSSAVLGILLLILLNSVTTSLSIWRVTEDRMGADREARSAFQMIADDLANAVVPTNTSGPMTNFWPLIRRDFVPDLSAMGVSNNVIGFHTLKPADYQQPGDVGDLCYVEYQVRQQTNTNALGNNVLLRRFVGSRETYDAMVAGRFPTNSTNPFQVLATNIIFNTNALKGTAVVRSSVLSDRTSVVPIFTRLRLVPSGTNFVYTNSPANQRPDAIQVSIGVADMDTLRNPALMANPNIQLRGGGFYTFTVNLPSP